MVVTTLIVTTVVMFTVHAVAKAMVMRRFGVTIGHAGLGLPYKPYFALPARGRRSFELTLSPWLFCTYVLPDEKGYERLAELPFREEAWVDNAGAVSSMTLAFGLLAIAGAVQHTPWVTVILGGLAAVFWLARRIVAAYVLPILAVPAPFALGALWVWVGRATAGVTSSPLDLVEIAGLVALLIAIVSMMPLMPFGNGFVVGPLARQLLGRRAAATYTYYGVLLAPLVVPLSFILGALLAS